MTNFISEVSLFLFYFSTSYLGKLVQDPFIIMASKGKLSGEMMKSFDGKGDIVAWLKKAELVAKLTEIKDLASFIPLFLEGDALALYLEMSDEDQLKADKIKSRLKEAFA